MQHPTWLALLLVLSLILPLAPAPAAAQTPAASPDTAGAPADADASKGRFQVDWTFIITGSNAGTYYSESWTAYRQVMIQGSATISDTAFGRAVSDPYQLTVTDTSHAVETGPCYQRVRHKEITEPSYYSGKNDIFWWSFGDHVRRPREDGSYFMTDPFRLDFWIAGEDIFRKFEYRTSYDQRTFCNPNRHTHSESLSESFEYYDWYTLSDFSNAVFEGDPDGVVFRKSGSWSYEGSKVFGHPLTMHVSFDATIRKIGGCADRWGPLDANDPVVKDIRLRVQVDEPTIPPNQGNTLNPPDPATVTVLATCEGVPVSNLVVKVASDALPYSGGHNHANTANPRPRGFLRGPQHNDYVEITAARPSITATTDFRGEAAIRFLPGRDNDSGNRGGRCAGDQRGIAGDYQIAVQALRPTKFQSRRAATVIEVARTDFVDLQDGENYAIRYNSNQHFRGTSGTAPTMQVIQRLADDFNAAQVRHNEELIAAGRPAWPLVELGIIDISLPDGGLYDSGGTNVCADGQPRANFIPWQIPHQTHLTGKGIDIPTAWWWAGATATQFHWWRNTLRALGCNYGTWAREAVFHLDADQSADGWGDFHAGCTYRRSEGAVAQDTSSVEPAMVTVPYAGADVFVSLLPNTFDEEIVVAAPGEVVSYTVGVNNLLGDAPAQAVEVKVTLPAGVTFVAGDPAPSRFDGTAPVWEVGDLAAGAFAKLYSLGVKVDDGLAPDTSLYLEATATSTTPEAITDNNREGNEITVRTPGPDLVVQSNLEAAPLTADAPVTVTLDLANIGSAVAPNAALDVTLPPGTEVWSSAPVAPTQTGQTLSWALGDLAVDAQQTLTVVLNLAAAATQPVDPLLGTSEVVTFTWQAKTTGDSDLSNNDGVVVKPLTQAGHDAQVSLYVAGAAVGELVTGQTVTYTVNYANLGNQTALSTTLSLRLGTGLRLLSSQPPAGAPVDGALPWALGDLPVGGEGAVTVAAQVESVPTQGNLTLAAIQATGVDIAPFNNVVYNERGPVQNAASGGDQRMYLPLLDR